MNLSSYKKVYDEFFRLARKIANDVLHDYYLAGDVAQEVFIEMFLKKDILEEKQIRYWIILNALRRAIDQKRRLYHRCETGMGLPGVGEFGGGTGNVPETVVLRKEETEFRLSALEELRAYNSDWYEILMRSYGEGESYQNLARDYDIKETNLRVQVHRARKWLNSKIRELYDD